MIDLHPAPVPDLSDEWMAWRRAELVEALSHRRRRPIKRTLLAGATGVAAAVSTLLVVGGSEQYAFAGWSASPTPPTGGQLTAADADCQARLAQAAQLAQTNKGLGADIASFVPELSDVRGPYTITVFGNGGDSAAMCLSFAGGLSLRWIMGSGAPVGTSSITVDQVSVLARGGQPYTLVEGRTGDAVSAVTLGLGSGTDVKATTGHGLFVAWWPGSQTIVSATLSTATGTSTQNLNLPGPSIPPAPKSAPPQPGAQSSCAPSASVGCNNP